MTEEAVLLSFLIFCVVMTGTPGPNNAMVLISGARVGVWRTMPLVSGIAAGVALQLAALGLGLGTVFDAIPGFHSALRIAGAAYILWLAWRIATSGPLAFNSDERSPMGFLGGVAFQWFNPKAWAVSISAAATYIPAKDHTLNVLIAAILMLLTTIPCVGLWAVGGMALRRVLARPGPALIFNLVMSVALVTATMPAILY